MAGRGYRGGVLVRSDARLADLTTLGVGGPVERLVEVTDAADVVAAVREAHDSGRRSVLLYVSRDGNERFEAIPLATS